MCPEAAMIATTRSAIPSGAGRTALPRPAQRRWSFTVTIEAALAAAVHAAEAPAPRRIDADLEGLLTDGAAVALPNRAHSAARAFGAGNGFLPGQIIDRSI
jgi:hypothetical protein